MLSSTANGLFDLVIYTWSIGTIGVTSRVTLTTLHLFIVEFLHVEMLSTTSWSKVL